MLEKISKLQIVMLGLILGLSLILSAALIASRASKDEISVTGTAFEIVKSDNAKWTISYKAEAPTRLEAYAKLSKATPVVKKFLTDKGIKEEQIDTGAIFSNPNYKYTPQGGMTQDILNYTYSQDIKVTSDNVELIKGLQNESQALVEQGIYIVNSGVEYYYSKLAEKKAELLAKATMDAKERAAGMLKAAHNRVGKMRSVKMGVFQITTPESNDVTDWGINDTSTIEKKVTAVANVVFAIK